MPAKYLGELGRQDTATGTGPYALTITCGFDVRAGDTVFIWVGFQGLTNVPSAVSDTAGNTWVTPGTHTVFAGGSYDGVMLYRSFLANSIQAGDTITLGGFSNDNAAVVAMAFRRVAHIAAGTVTPILPATLSAGSPWLHLCANVARYDPTAGVFTAPAEFAGVAPIGYEGSAATPPFRNLTPFYGLPSQTSYTLDESYSVSPANRLTAYISLATYSGRVRLAHLPNGTLVRVYFGPTGALLADRLDDAYPPAVTETVTALAASNYIWDFELDTRGDGTLLLLALIGNSLIRPVGRLYISRNGGRSWALASADTFAGGAAIRHATHEARGAVPITGASGSNGMLVQYRQELGSWQSFAPTGGSPMPGLPHGKLIRHSDGSLSHFWRGASDELQLSRCRAWKALTANTWSSPVTLDAGPWQDISGVDLPQRGAVALALWDEAAETISLAYARLNEAGDTYTLSAPAVVASDATDGMDLAVTRDGRLLLAYRQASDDAHVLVELRDAA